MNRITFLAITCCCLIHGSQALGAQSDSYFGSLVWSHAFGPRASPHLEHGKHLHSPAAQALIEEQNRDSNNLGRFGQFIGLNRLLNTQEPARVEQTPAASHATTSAKAQIAPTVELQTVQGEKPTTIHFLKRQLSNSTSEEDTMSEIAPANVRLAFILAGCVFLAATAALVIYWVRSNVNTKASDREEEANQAREAALAALADAPPGRCVSFSGEDPAKLGVGGVAPLPGITESDAGDSPTARPASVKFAETNPMLSKSKRRLAV